MARTIGRAADFFRVRVIRIDATDAVEFDWRDDILYRRPPEDRPDEEEAFQVEAVLLDNDDVVAPIATFVDGDAAHAFLEQCEGDLEEMTKSEFEARYLKDVSY